MQGRPLCASESTTGEGKLLPCSAGTGSEGTLSPCCAGPGDEQALSSRPEGTGGEGALFPCSPGTDRDSTYINNHHLSDLSMHRHTPLSGKLSRSGKRFLPRFAILESVY